MRGASVAGAGVGLGHGDDSFPGPSAVANQGTGEEVTVQTHNKCSFSMHRNMLSGRFRVPPGGHVERQPRATVRFAARPLVTPRPQPTQPVAPTHRLCDQRSVGVS